MSDSEPDDRRYRIRFDLRDRSATLGDSRIRLEDHQLGQIRRLAEDELDQAGGQRVLEQVEDRMRRCIRDCGRPVTTTTLEQEFIEAFDVHLGLLCAEEI